jgi:hypothetical protein
LAQNFKDHSPDQGGRIAASANESCMNLNEQRETFDALVRQHESVRSPKRRELMELRDSIAEARKRGASYEVISTYLLKTAITVSPDTVARFCHEILAEPKGRITKRKKNQARAHKNGTAADLVGQQRAAGLSSMRYSPPTGPRIVDPKTL